MDERPDVVVVVPESTIEWVRPYVLGGGCAFAMLFLLLLLFIAVKHRRKAGNT